MISRNVGSLLDVTHGILVHGVNCQGMMGAGIAAAIASKWPNVLHRYRLFCRDRGTEHAYTMLGQVQLVEIAPELFVANAFTQPDPGPCASYDAIAECFERLGGMAGARNLPLHFPLIGCGIGGLRWPVVAAIIDECAITPEKHLWVLP